MSIKFFGVVLVSALVPLTMSGADKQAAPTKAAPKLTAAQIVEKNVAARGGASAWHAVNTLEVKGKMEAGGNDRSGLRLPGNEEAMKYAPARPKEQALLPFLMDLERGRKQRLEIEFKGQTAIQVYNGSQGWKVRPFLNRHEVEKYTPEEAKIASTQTDLDGLLIDYAAKGSKVELVGVDKVEGKSAYNLKVTDKNGFARHVWVDAETFLEAKMEGNPRRLDGKYHPVATYYRDYRSVNGLKMPFLLETAVEGVRDTEKIMIETIVSNPKLDESRFAMPQ